MSGTFKLVKEFMSALNASEQNKTQPYDTQGTVKRVEGDTAWVQLTGSDRETPIQMTIACDVGDTVQARIGGGSAWLTGNLTAPPTDDKKAVEAITMVNNVVQEVQETLEDVSAVDDVSVQYCLSDSSSTFTQYGDWSNTPPTYVSGKYYWTRSVIEDDEGNATYGEPRYSQDTQLSVETDVAFKSNNNHFWHDSSGAYVTTANKNYSSGYATRITSSGILQSYSGNLLSSWTSSGISFYQGDTYNTPTASFGSGGAEIYSGGTSVASFGSTARIGANSGVHVTLEAGSLAGWMNFYNSSGTLSGRIESHSSGVRLTNAAGTYYSYYDVSDNGYLTLSAAHTVQIDASQNISIDASGMTFIDGDSGVVMNSQLTVYADGIFNNSKADDVYTKCSLGEGGSSTANCRLGATSGGYYRLCLVQGGSSKRYKHDIKPIEEETLDPHRLYDAEVIQFVYNDGYLGEDDCRYNRPLSGFIAEDLHKVYPIAVDVEDGKCETWNERYIIPPMLALIQEQNKRIAELEKRVL